jgi:23S rRNA (adenine2503-C2)-methyltransferase
MGQTVDILSLGNCELNAWLQARDHPSYRRKQILSWIFQQLVTDFDEMTNLPENLIEELQGSFHVEGRRVLAVSESSDGSAAKLLIALEDGQRIETVRMLYRYGYSVCISSQVGCKVGCPFCASGASGFVRDLSAGEMLAQVLCANRSLAGSGRVSSVVVMGMGEPLDNFDNLVRFLDLAHDRERLGLSYRRITVSTAGLVPRILDLAALELPITLAISLHAATDALRDKLVPLNRAYPLAALMDAAHTYVSTTGRRITFEYALIKDVNDSRECAELLARTVRGMRCHVNLIPLNPVEGVSMSRSTRQDQFASVLAGEGIEVTVRRELGIDIDAACGQLRRRLAEP